MRNTAIYNGLANKGGVYKITNTANGRTYIGSTYRFKKRCQDHYANLISNKHQNQFLQNDWNKCGESCFLFEAIWEENEEKTRLLKEQEWIDKYYDSQKRCYNLKKTADSSRLDCFQKNPINPTIDGRCKPHTVEHNEKVGPLIKEALADPETKAKLIKGVFDAWTERTDPNVVVTHKETNESITIHEPVKRWCEARQLDPEAFYLMLNGTTKSSQGWFLGTTPPEYVERKGEKRKPLTQEHRNKIAGGRHMGVVLANTQTLEKQVVPENIKDLAKTLNIDYTTLAKVLQGKCPSVNGWILWIPELEQKPIVQTTVAGVFIAHHESVLFASKAIGFQPEKIIRTANKQQVSCQNFGFVWKEEWDQKQVTKTKSVPPSTTSPKPPSYTSSGRPIFIKPLSPEATSPSEANTLMFFHDEWDNPQKNIIIQSMIKHREGKSPTRVFARQCKVVEVDSKQSREWFDENHLSGGTQARKTWALVDWNEDVVAALSVRLPHQQKKWGEKTIEIARFATARHAYVVGGLSRLLSRVKSYASSEGFDTILTYVDLRIGDGHGYKKLGFVRVENQSMNWWWTNGEVRVDRFRIKAQNGVPEKEMAKQHPGGPWWKTEGMGTGVFVLKVGN